jgi:cytochrome c5
MRNTMILITAVLLLILGMTLTACGSKATATNSQLPSVQATASQPPVIQATATQPAVVQATATEPQPIQVTATQTPVVQATTTEPLPVQATATQPPVVQATATPATGDDGQALLNERCTICHNLNRVTSLRNTADQWNKVVSRMIQNGAQLAPAEQTVLANYLAKTYGP